MANKKYYKVKKNGTFKGKFYEIGSRIYLTEEQKKELRKIYII